MIYCYDFELATVILKAKQKNKQSDRERGEREQQIACHLKDKIIIENDIRLGRLFYENLSFNMKWHPCDDA